MYSNTLVGACVCAMRAELDIFVSVGLVASGIACVASTATDLPSAGLLALARLRHLSMSSSQMLKT